MKRIRTSETIVETMHRQEQNRLRMAKQRALESPNETAHRQMQSQLRMTQRRASETLNETLHRQQRNRTHMAAIRCMDVSVDNAISAFLSKARKVLILCVLVAIV